MCFLSLALNMKFTLLQIIQSSPVIHFSGNPRTIIKSLFNQVKSWKEVASNPTKVTPVVGRFLLSSTTIDVYRLGEPLLVQKRTATSSNSRPNTSTSATFDQIDQTSDQTSTDDNASAQNRNERSPVRVTNALFCFSNVRWALNLPCMSNGRCARRVLSFSRMSLRAERPYTSIVSLHRNSLSFSLYKKVTQREDLRMFPNALVFYYYRLVGRASTVMFSHRYFRLRTLVFVLVHRTRFIKQQHSAKSWTLSQSLIWITIRKHSNGWSLRLSDGIPIKVGPKERTPWKFLNPFEGSSFSRLAAAPVSLCSIVPYSNDCSRQSEQNRTPKKNRKPFTIWSLI